MTDATPATPASDPTYEQARDELIEIVSKLEAGGVPLEESLTLWQRGEELAALCERYLHGARERLDAVTATDTGTAPDSR